MEDKLHIYIRPERSWNRKRKHDVAPLIFLSFSICWLSQSQLLSRLRRPLYWPLLSWRSLPVHLTCVIISALRNAPSSSRTLADGLEKGRTGAGWSWPGTSCSPRDGCTVFLGLHPQRSYAGGFAVWVDVEIIAVDSASHPGTPEKAAHVRLSHVAAAWTGHAQEIGNARGSVRVRRHAGGNGITWHNAARHRWRAAAASNPRRVLDLKWKSLCLPHVTSLN